MTMTAAERIAEHTGRDEYLPISGPTCILGTILVVANNLEETAHRLHAQGDIIGARAAHRDGNVLRKALGIPLVRF